MKNLILILFVFFIEAQVQASMHIGGVVITKGCVNLDGVPVAKGSKCCDAQGNFIPGPDCTAGPSMISYDAGTGISQAVKAAKATLSDAKELNGVTTGDRTVAPEVAADTAGMGGLGDGVKPNSGDANGVSGAGGAGGGSGAGANGGASGSGGNGGGLAYGNASTSRNAEGEKGTSGTEDAAGGYVKAGAGKEAKDEGGLFGNLLGSIGMGDKAAPIDGTLNGMKFGEESGANGAGDALEGSTSDSPDYLKRIDVGASIFKIVTKRYVKESLKKHVGTE